MCLSGHLLPRILPYLFSLFIFVFYFSEFNSIGRKLSISGPLIAAIPKKMGPDLRRYEIQIRIRFENNGVFEGLAPFLPGGYLYRLQFRCIGLPLSGHQRMA